MTAHNRKLPPDTELLRLYWDEEQTVAEIAARFQTSYNAAYDKLRELKAPIRKRGHARKYAGKHCVNCTRPVCRIKRMEHGRYVWRLTCRCAPCHHLYIRKINTRTSRRSRGYQSGKPKRSRLTLGRLSTIAPEDWPR